MKKLLLTMCLMGSGVILYAQNAPSINEDTIELNKIWDVPNMLPSNVNAHSHGNLDINGVNSDLYVFTWDYGNPIGVVNKGFAVRQYVAGIHVDNSTSPLYQAIRYNISSHLPYNTNSEEAGILQHDDSTFIALTYSADIPSSGGYIKTFFLRLYLWNPALPGGPLIELNTYTLGQTGNPNYFWIHQDVNNLNSIVISWVQDGYIMTTTGVMTTSGLKLSGTGVLNVSDMDQPDVAMMRGSNGAITLSYVFTSLDKHRLYVYQGSFSTLNAIPYGTTTSFSVTQAHQSGTSGTYGVPRIDAPDNAQYSGQENVWSCVVSDHQTNNDYIRATTYSNLTGITTKTLNDATLGSLQNISSTTNSNIYNRRPVVAFSNEGLQIFYAWVFRNSSWYSSWYSSIDSVSYLSVKTTLSLGLLNVPNTQYFIVPYNNYNDNRVPSIGLSTQNDASPQLFTAFTQGSTSDPGIPFFGLKTVDWNTTTGYKPNSNTGLTNISDQKQLTISPNPFHNGFHIEHGILPQQRYSLTLFNILGQKVFEASGNIEQLNQGVSNIGKQFISGTYFIELKGKDGSIFRKEMVKW